MTDELTPKTARPVRPVGQTPPAAGPDAASDLHAASCAIPLPIPLPDAKFPLPGGLALGS